MFAIVLLGLVACANAAPRHCGHHHHNHHHGRSYYQDDDMDDLGRYIESQMFDTRRFWSELSIKMMRLDKMLADLSKRFPNNEASVQINDNEYKISLPLQGFVEKEIIVKAKKGLVVVQAIRKVAGEPDREYFNIKMLPDYVGENGSWTYKNGLLEIIFPIIEFKKEVVTQTAAPGHSRDENQNNGQNKEQNKDILERGDVAYAQQRDLETNEISHQENTVEATTHAVDFNDDVNLITMPSYY